MDGHSGKVGRNRGNCRDAGPRTAMFVMATLVKLSFEFGCSSIREGCIPKSSVASLSRFSVRHTAHECQHPAVPSPRASPLFHSQSTENRPVLQVSQQAM